MSQSNECSRSAHVQVKPNFRVGDKPEEFWVFGVVRTHVGSAGVVRLHVERMLSAAVVLSSDRRDLVAACRVFVCKLL